MNRTTELTQFAFLVSRYVAVGGTSAVVETLLFLGMTTLMGLPVMYSNVIAVSVVTVLGFLGQKHFTFRSNHRISPEAVLYVVQLSINFLLNNAFVFAFTTYLQLNPATAKIAQLGICFVFNFSFSRFIVFRPRS